MDLILFAGTSEGRQLASLAAEWGLETLVSVATDYGKEQIEPAPCLQIQDERLEEAEMEALFAKYRPSLIVDATHPHAVVVSQNIRQAAAALDLPVLRTARASQRLPALNYFSDLDTLLTWLTEQEGKVFSSLGLKSAAALTQLPDFQERLVIRVLPHSEGLRQLEELGYLHRQVIAMQGPFSKELNLAMFQASEAKILLTKDSGSRGGFEEKIRAAQALHMQIAVLEAPSAPGGMALAELEQKMREIFFIGECEKHV
ncbi:MAG: precorrin-6A reductase [Eubacteriales bacterium]|nr:precorrin-6A reductase [Eubacteriales bacterium]